MIVRWLFKWKLKFANIIECGDFLEKINSISTPTKIATQSISVIWRYEVKYVTYEARGGFGGITNSHEHFFPKTYDIDSNLENGSNFGIDEFK